MTEIRDLIHMPHRTLLGLRSGSGGGRQWFLFQVGKYPWPHLRSTVSGTIFTEINNFIKDANVKGVKENFESILLVKYHSTYG